MKKGRKAKKKQQKKNAARKRRQFQKSRQQKKNKSKRKKRRNKSHRKYKHIQQIRTNQTDLIQKNRNLVDCHLEHGDNKIPSNAEIQKCKSIAKEKKMFLKYFSWQELKEMQ
eukprot:209523_1